VRVNLVAGVPDEAVAGEVEGQVQGQAEFHDAEVAGEVGRTDAQHTHQFVTHFLGQLSQLLITQPLQISGASDTRQESAHLFSPSSVVCGPQSVGVFATDY
jgi:hypothetical protein